MEIFECIDTRKTIRKYSDYIPTDDEIKRIINSARLAPAAMNTQNWKFLAIFNKDIKHKMAEAVFKKYDEITSRIDEDTARAVSSYKAHSTFFETAPAIIVCIETNAPSFMGGVLEKANYSKEEISKMRPDSYLLSMGGAVENMSLAAHALGLSSCWMVAPVLAVKAFKEILNLKEDNKIVTILTIGKPYADNPNRAPKKPLEDVMEIIK